MMIHPSQTVLGMPESHEHNADAVADDSNSLDTVQEMTEEQALEELLKELEA